MKPASAVLLLSCALLTACPDGASRFKLTLEVLNPTDLRFEGSGGALGAGVEFRVPGLESGQELIVDDTCQGRHCGAYAETDPGRCGVEAREIEANRGFKLGWDGRYFPRSVDAFGECLGGVRTVEPGNIRVAVCGRLLGGDVSNAQLQCVEHVIRVEDVEAEQVVSVNVPGVPAAAAVP